MKHEKKKHVKFEIIPSYECKMELIPTRVTTMVQQEMIVTEQISVYAFCQLIPQTFDSSLTRMHKLGHVLLFLYMRAMEAMLTRVHKLGPVLYIIQ